MTVRRATGYARRPLWRWLDVDPWAVAIVLGGVFVAACVLIGGTR